MRRLATAAVLAGLAVVLAGCYGETEPATDITENSATLHAKTGCSADYSGRFWYEGRELLGEPAWGRISPEWPFDCPPDPDPATPGYPKSNPTDIPFDWTGLSPLRDYQYRLCSDVDGPIPVVCTDSTENGNGTSYDGFKTLDRRLPSGPPGSWTLVWSDEFSGTTLDRAKWDCQGFTNNRMRSNCANITVGNGEARLIPDSDREGAQAVSSGSAGYALPVGGVAEARVYFPGDPANCEGGIYNWPAWWSSGPNWPQAGEIDIAEELGGRLTINYHSPNLNTNFGAQPGCWANAFHVYTVHRKASSADVYWDGVLQESFATQDNGVGQQLILTAGFNSSGGNYGDQFAVRADYVRAWAP